MRTKGEEILSTLNALNSLNTIYPSLCEEAGGPTHPFGKLINQNKTETKQSETKQSETKQYETRLACACTRYLHL